MYSNFSHLTLGYISITIYSVALTQLSLLCLFNYEKDMKVWAERGEINVNCNVMSVILVQMSARLSPDKETELSNCFLLLLPW